MKKSKQYSYKVFGFEISEREDTLATFSLESGGLILRNGHCGYNSKGNLEFGFPCGPCFSPKQEDPAPGIVKQLEKEIDKLKKAKGDQWNVYIEDDSIPF